MDFILDDITELVIFLNVILVCQIYNRLSLVLENACGNIQGIFREYLGKCHEFLLANGSAKRNGDRQKETE